MIKVKLLNPNKGRNEPTFRPLRFVTDKLRDYSIDLTTSNDYDYLFVGMADFIDKKLPLNESIDKGLESLSKISGDYFLFDGSDSHSLMGAYEVFTQSKAIYLFKNQLHRTPEMYKTPKAFGKWYFGETSGLELGYDISPEEWNNIKLTGWNMMSNVPDHKKYVPISKNKNIDICAIFGATEGNKSYDHTIRNDELYLSHRKDIWKALNKLSSKYTIVSGRHEWRDYMHKLYNSKISISPFGMGEIRQGDGEAVQMGTVICKEDMSMFNTGPDVWKPNETYVPFKYDCSNLDEVLDEFLSNYHNNQHIVDNMRKLYLSEYSDEALCMKWYNIFSNMNSVTTHE